MDQITQRNAASAEETASASEELSAQAQGMKEQVGILSAQVGGQSAKSPEQPTGHSTAGAHAADLRGTAGGTVNRAKSVASLTGNISNESRARSGNGRKAAKHNVDPEAVIPMGENRVVEHDAAHNDF